MANGCSNAVLIQVLKSHGPNSARVTGVMVPAWLVHAHARQAGTWSGGGAPAGPVGGLDVLGVCLIVELLFLCLLPWHQGQQPYSLASCHS
jgi:hypothetical protein